MSLESTLLQHGVPPRYAKAARSMLAYGTEGAVYDLGNGQVLKVNVTARHQHFENVVRRVRGKAWAATPIAWGPLRPPGRRPQGFWYTAYRMNPVSTRERKILDAIGYAIMGKAKGALPAHAADKRMLEAIRLLPAELQSVVRAARRAGYHDIHGRNVMVTDAGHYKVIDVESLRPLKRQRGASPLLS